MKGVYSFILRVERSIYRVEISQGTLGGILNNRNILEMIYKYYPLAAEESGIEKVKMRMDKIQKKSIYKKDLINNVITIARDYEVVDWTDAEACCYEFKILLHKYTPILDDDRILIKKLNGKRNDLRIFISVLEPCYYMFEEKTSYCESEDQWKFRTEESDTDGIRELKEAMKTFLRKSGYAELSHSDVLIPVFGIETLYKEAGQATVFDCLFTDLVNIN